MDININSQYVQIQGANIHYLEAGTENTSPVIFLHGASFKAQTWEELGSLKLLAKKGYRAVAVDLPGYGSSQRTSGSPQEFLLTFIEKLNLNLPIVISPSMSGGYSLPFIVNYPDKLTGFVPIAPVGISRYGKQLKGINLPTLAIWGSNDRIVPVSQADFLLQQLPNANKVILENAGHACYMRSTDEFHKHLIEFLEILQYKNRVDKY